MPETAQVWSQAEAEQALAREQDVLGKMAENLFDLTQDQTYRLLEGADLSGATATAWSTASDALHSAWGLLGESREVVKRALDVRGKRRRLGPEECRRLQDLLTGEAVVLEAREVPPALRRASESGLALVRVSLARARELVDAEYSRAAAVVSAVAGIQPALDLCIEGLVRDLREIEALAPEPEAFETLRADVAWLLSVVRTDPLSFQRAPTTSHPDPDIDGEAFEPVHSALRRLREQTEHRRLVRERVGDDLARLGRAVEETAAAENAAARRRSEVLAHVVVRGFAPVHVTVGLRRQLGRAEALCRLQRWTESEEVLRVLREQLAAARHQIGESAQRAEGLLAELHSLQAQLHSYQARAQRLGCVEHTEVDDAYQKSYELVVRQRPCDLPAAAASVEDYRRLIERHRDHPGGTR
jgi:hypothetical protein